MDRGWPVVGHMVQCHHACHPIPNHHLVSSHHHRAPHDPKHPQIGVPNSRQAATRPSPAPESGRPRPPRLALEGVEAQLAFSEASSRAEGSAQRGAGRACLSGGVSCCWGEGGVHELLVVDLAASSLPDSAFHPFPSPTG